MSSHAARNLTRSEKTFIGDVLRRLREHFPEWTKMGLTDEGAEYDLVGFAFYEGCGDTRHCGDILAEAAPFAIGRKLVEDHGFRWVMLASEAAPRYAVGHPALAEPIELASLENGAWNDQEYEIPPARGRRTHESLVTILARIASRS